MKNQIDIWQIADSLFRNNNAIGELTGLLTDEDIARIELKRRLSEKQVKIVSSAFYAVRNHKANLRARYKAEKE